LFFYVPALSDLESLSAHLRFLVDVAGLEILTRKDVQLVFLYSGFVGLGDGRGSFFQSYMNGSFTATPFFASGCAPHKRNDAIRKKYADHCSLFFGLDSRVLDCARNVRAPAQRSAFSGFQNSPGQINKEGYPLD
jgi:hypothetical protein